MIVDRIQYKKIFALGNYTTEHIGLEASLDEKESPEDALNHLKTMVEELHKVTLAEMEQYKGTVTMVADNPTIPNVQVEQPSMSQNDAVIESIRSCTTLKAVKIFEKMVNRGNIPEIVAVYEEMIKKLS